MTPTDYLRSHPNASTKEVMQACGCSRRAVRHAQEQLRLEQGSGLHLSCGALTDLQCLTDYRPAASRACA